MMRARITAFLWLCFSLFFYIWQGTSGSLLLLTATGLLLAGGALLTVAPKACRVSLSLPDTAGKGETVCIKAGLKNLSFFPVCRCKAIVECRNILTGENLDIPVFFSAWPKGVANMELEVNATCCGCLVCRIKDVKLCDLFSIYSISSRLQAEARICIMPQLWDVELSSQELYAYQMESCQYSHDRKGSDPGDTFAIREYREGDSLKAIHWKLTGKTGQIMVKEPGLPVENSVMLLLEKGMQKGESLSAQQRDRAAELFLSLSHALLEKETVHCTGWQDYRTGKFIVRRISCAEELWAMSGMLMESPYEEDSVSAQVHCLEHYSELQFARYLYVTAGSARSINELESYGAVTVYQA